MKCERCGIEGCLCDLIELFEPKADVKWMDDASCQGLPTEIFFLEPGQNAIDAKEVCEGCLVRLQCLEYALDTHQQFGIWGGLTERERRPIKKRRLQRRRTA